MDKQQEKGKLSLRSKSPIIMSNRQKMALLNCNEQSTSNIHGFNENSKVLNCKCRTLTTLILFNLQYA